MLSAFLQKLINWYFNKKSLPFWCILLVDCLLVFLSYMIVIWRMRSGVELLSIFYPVVFTLLFYLLFYAIGFKLFHTYSGILRYSSFVDLQKIGLAMLFGGVCAFLLHYIIPGHWFFVDINGNEIIFATLLASLLLWGERIFVKILYDVSLTSINSKYALIYGNGDSVALAKQIRNEKPTKFIVKGFLSENKNDTSRLLMGEKVYPLDDQLPELIEEKGIEAVLIAPSKEDSFRNNAALQNTLINAGIHIYISEHAKEWESTEDERQKPLKEISIEDLLPRAPINIDLANVKKQLRGKNILITGAAGSIGSEIVKQVAQFRPKMLILIDPAETPLHDMRLMMRDQFPNIVAKTILVSICQKHRMDHIFKTYRPEYVFHAGAYKHVPMLEDNPSESIYNNVIGTKIIADLALKYGSRKFVMISTDKAVNPTNVMGCSKRICEIYVQSLDNAIKNGQMEGVTKFITTRFGNVLNSNGSVIPLFEKQIRLGGPVTVPHPDIVRYFMLIPEACKLVLEAGTKGEGGEIFVFNMGSPVKIADLAKKMIRLSGARDVEIKYTGLRAGEKLYEEVLSNKETTLPSFNDKIRIAKVKNYEYASVNREVMRLYKLSLGFDDMATVGEMKKMVPEFVSNNSVYQKLDVSQ